jgi:hypothetical protein
MSGQHLKRQVAVRLMERGLATATRLPEVAECLSSIGVSTTTKKLQRLLLRLRSSFKPQEAGYWTR